MKNKQESWAVITASGSYMMNTAVSSTDTTKAKKFSTKEEAEAFIQKIHSQAEWMRNFKCNAVRI